jgi:hypothetical protein
MDTQPPLTFAALLTHIIGDIARALCERPGESPQQRAARMQAVTHAIMAFQPGDVAEAMYAGHCVMFHEMIVDSLRDTMRSEDDAARHVTRSNIVAMDKVFGNNLTRLERHRASRAEASPEARPAIPRAETDIADRIQRHLAWSPEPQRQTAPAQPPAAEMIAGCLANQQAMAATDAAHPARSAMPLNLDQTGVECLAPSPAQVSGVNGQAAANPSRAQPPAYSGNRQARRHPNR